MIAKIIPIKRLPLKFSYFDYLVPDALSGVIRIGQLVHIPFRNKTDFGMVMALDDKSEIETAKLKPIEGIVFDTPLLSNQIISYLVEISEFYRAPLGFVLKSSLLPLQKRKIKNLANLPALPVNPAHLPQKPELSCYSNEREMMKLLCDNLLGDGQKLILVPELYQIEKIRNVIPDNNIYTFTGEVSDKEYFDLWIKVRSEKNITIIGTRRALFLPWINLRVIALEDEGNPNYKSWDMAPRIHTRDAALMLSKFTGAKLFLMSHSPSVESYYFAEKNVYGKNIIPIKIPANDLVFVDMAAERRSHNYSPISNDLLEAVKTSAGDSYLLINKYGSAQFVSCRDCGFVFRCDNCKRPMTYFDDNNKKLGCHFCKNEFRLPTGCPECKGFNMRFSNLGTDGVAAEIKQLLGDAAPKIIIINKMDPNSLAKLAEPAGISVRGRSGIYCSL